MAQTTTTTAVANKPAWVDLATSDAAAARDFYAKLFGWNLEVSEDPQYGGYATAKIGDKSAGGAHVEPMLDPRGGLDAVGPLIALADGIFRAWSTAPRREPGARARCASSPGGVISANADWALTDSYSEPDRARRS